MDSEMKVSRPGTRHNDHATTQNQISILGVCTVKPPHLHNSTPITTCQRKYCYFTVNFIWYVLCIFDTQ